MIRTFKNQVTNEIIAKHNELDLFRKHSTCLLIDDVKFVDKWNKPNIYTTVEYAPRYIEVPNEEREITLDFSYIGHHYYSSIRIGDFRVNKKDISKLLCNATIKKGKIKVKVKYATHASGYNILEYWTGKQWKKLQIK